MLQRLTKRIKPWVVSVAAVSLIWSSYSVYEANAYSGFGEELENNSEELSPGTSYHHSFYQSDSLMRSVHRIDLQPSQSRLELSVADPLGSLKTTTQHALDATYDGHYVSAGVNASFIEPDSLIVHEGKLLNLNILEKNTSEVLNQMKAFGMLSDGSPHIGTYEASMSLKHDGMEWEISGMNIGRKSDSAVLFTPRYMESSTSANPYHTELVVETEGSLVENFSFGDHIEGKVTDISPFGEGEGVPIPENGFVVAVNDKDIGEQWQEVIEEGDTISITSDVNEPWGQSEFMIATGPGLVENGIVNISMDENESFVTQRHPRAAIGYDRDSGEIFMVVIDGRQSGFSDGATLKQLAEYMISLGADEAINLDGGGSAAMVARLPGFEYAALVNQPSNTRERAVPTSLQVTTDQPAPPFTEDVDVLEDYSSLHHWELNSAKASAELLQGNHYQPNRIGPNTAKIDYVYTGGKDDTSAVYLKSSYPRLLKGQPKKIGAWVYGDGNEHWLRANIKDRSGNSHRINFTEQDGMDWIGWRYVTADIPNNIEAPYSFEQVYIAQPDQNKMGAGTVYVDQIEVIYNDDYTVERFTDVDNEKWDWAYHSILTLNDRHVISGFPNGSFKPGESITREQAATMLARELELDTSDRPDPDYHDVDEESSFYEDIAAVTDEGLLQGKAQGTFGPKDLLTRAEMAVILQNAYSIEGTTDETFTDVSTDHWAYDAIQALVANDLTAGYPNGTYKPSESVSRAEFSVFLGRM